MAGHVRSGRAADLPSLQPAIQRFVVAVLLGSPAATRLLEEHGR